MGYRTSTVFSEMDEKNEDFRDVIRDRENMLSLLETYPCVLIPTTSPSLTEEENEKRDSFLFSVFNQQGLICTFLYGTSLDPKLNPPHEGNFKHSKMEPCDFLLISDIHGEDITGRPLFMFAGKVSAVCEIPWFAISGGTFKNEVLTTIVSTRENLQASLLQVILQNRICGNVVAKMSVPFCIDAVDTQVTCEKKFYKLTSDSDVTVFLRNNKRITDWREMR